VRILVAPSAFKGTFTPRQVADAIAVGIKAKNPTAEITFAPLADGGDGTIDVVHECLGGQFVKTAAVDAIGRVHWTHWLNADGAAFLELSTICGLALLGPSMRVPLLASTFGLGQVLKTCLELAPKKVFITVGGSASTDGGAGALQALGAKLLDKNGRELPRGGAALCQLETVDLSAMPKVNVAVEVLVDVSNPLLGPYGAARIYSAQKGASPKQTEILEEGVTRLADCLEEAVGLKIRDQPGAGAAGGTAFGLALGLGAGIVSGAGAIAQLLSLEAKIENCDLVISAEGKFDQQSIMGKATGLLVELCEKHRRPLRLIAACVDPEFNWQDYRVDNVVTCATLLRNAELGDIARAAQLVV
jgi:glycerate 2-kinase